MRPSIRELWLLSCSFGIPWLAYRLGYETRRRTGMLERRTPVTSWLAQPLQGFLTDTRLADPKAYLDYRRTQAPAFFFSPADRDRYGPLLTGWDQSAEAHTAGRDASPAPLAEGVVGGRFRYFQHTVAQVGSPPNWHMNPFTGQQVPADQHWSRVDEFAHGDIKVIWELSRFGFTYALVRAYWRTRDQRYAECFWQLVEDWRQHNPPQQGPNWRCGQETSFRVMAWAFGLYGFLDCAVTTPKRVAWLAEMLAVSGKRIAANLDYALSQRNNHGISEGMGLWTLGSLFPELRGSSQWQEMGRRTLESQGRELIYDDGSFAQHSVVYHRLMLHDYVWALRLGDLHGRSFSQALRERVRAAGEFLGQIQDVSTGQVPYYGQNDGALILPLSNCGYLDFRPVIQTTHYLCQGARRYDEGPWDEDLLWLFGPDALESSPSSPARPARLAGDGSKVGVDPAAPSDLRAEAGGYYTLRSPEGFAFTRCGLFRHRPGQADMLHVDLWWRGQNIALDPGTFSYNAPPPWDNCLARTIYHNTASVDGRDAMDRAGRFLWLPWARGQVRCCQRSADARIAYLEGEHDGYRRLPSPARHRRAILLLAEQWWLVVDNLNSRGAHEYRVHWLLPDVPYAWEPATGRLGLDTPTGPYHVALAAESAGARYSLVRADDLSPRGWRAPYYGYREPALSLEMAAQASNETFWTVFGPQPCRICVAAGRPQLILETDDWRAVLQRGVGEHHPLISSVVHSAVFDSRSSSRLDLSGCTFS